MPDHRPAVSCRPRRWTALVTGLVAAAALTGGCSFIPSGTGPQPASAPAPPPGAGPCCGLLVRGPQPTWGPEDVVRNFLLASAIRANHFRVARQYLTQNANRDWQPSTAVTILTTEPQETLLQPHVSGPGTNPTVLVVGTEQAILNSAGQYIPAPGGKATDQPTEEFALQKVNGVYKIDQLIPPGHSKVSHELLLTSALFRLEYTPRNLYYYGLRNTQLVPYPVFVPIQGEDPPVTLIDDLIKGPSGWLRGAAESAFPPRSHLVPPIQVFPGPSGGRTAVVNIAVPGDVRGWQESRMAAQLVATLTSPVYSPPLFRAVKIKFNGRPWQPFGHPGSALGLSASQRYIPHLPADAEAYYLAQGGVLRSLSPGSDRGVVVTRGPGAAQVSLTKIAVSPGGGRLAGLAGPANTVYTGILVTKPGHRQSVEQLQAQLSGTSFSSLSWDNSDNLWVVSTKGHRQGVRVLVTGQGPGLPAHLPDLGGPVTSLRVAPDGVRVAMIVGEGTRAHLVLAAAMRDSGGGFSLTEPAPLFSALPPVSALTWYDEDHLLVITGSGENSQYWEVPVDGYNPTSLVKLPGLTTVTAAGPGHPIYLGLENGGLERATGLNQSLVPITPGQAIIYPG
jgi:lipoprotein LpqB-like beta-propeller protein